MKGWNLVALGFCCLVVGGCAEMTHLTRQRTAAKDEYVFIDAKQRALISRNNITCAEPSPDALSAIAASQGLNLSTPEGANLAQSLTLAESAGSIGLRTQSIQILRDHMFRVCEAYQSGQISKLEAALLQRRFQTTVIGILAIEQLTGAVRGPALVLGGSAEAGDAEAVVRLTESREKQAGLVNSATLEYQTAQTQTKSAQGEIDKATAALAGATDENRQTLQKALQDKEQKLETEKREELQAQATLLAAQSGLAAIDRALGLAGATGSASAGGEITFDSSTRPGDMAAVASAVQAIVEGTYKLGTKEDFCVMVLARAVESEHELKAAALSSAAELSGSGMRSESSAFLTQSTSFLAEAGKLPPNPVTAECLKNLEGTPIPAL